MSKYGQLHLQIRDEFETDAARSSAVGDSVFANTGPVRNGLLDFEESTSFRDRSLFLRRTPFGTKANKRVLRGHPGGALLIRHPSQGLIGGRGQRAPRALGCSTTARASRGPPAGAYPFQGGAFIYCPPAGLEALEELYPEKCFYKKIRQKKSKRKY